MTNLSPVASGAQSLLLPPGGTPSSKLPYSSEQPAEFNHAAQFVNIIQVRFSQEPETYKQFLEILQKYLKEQRPYQEVHWRDY